MPAKNFFVSCVFLVACLNQRGVGGDAPRVAIIGAGIGGTSSAFFLSNEVPGADINIFETSQVGGRLETVLVNGREYEIGGSVIHPLNKYMVDFLPICGLQKAKEPTSKSTYSLLKDGEVIYQQSSYAIWEKLRMIWRYGLWSLMKFSKLVDFYLENFLQIYPALDDGDVFPTVKDILLSMGPISKNGSHSTEMLDSASISLKEKLEEIEISDILINELVRVATRVNYGQMPGEMDAFVGTISLAGAVDGLWSVEGGNYRIPEKLISLANAHLRKKKVSEVKKIDDKFHLLISDEHDQKEEEEFDIVIVAAPQTDDQNTKLKFVGVETLAFPGSFHRTVATIVHGLPNPIYLGFKDSAALTKTNFFLSPDNILRSMAQLKPVNFDPSVDNRDSNVWKIFSSRLLTESELSNLFTERYATVVRDWLAYPSYKTRNEMVEYPFELSPGLYYINNVEWAASAMEMSALSARNVVNMAVKHWAGRQKTENTQHVTNEKPRDLNEAKPSEKSEL